MKLLSFFLLSTIFCFLVTAEYTPLKGYDKVTSKEEIARIDYIIQSGATAALDLAIVDEVIPEESSQRYEIGRVNYVSKQYRDADEVTSYFVDVKLVDLEDENVKAKLGFVIDRKDKNGRLKLRAYNIKFAENRI